MIYGFVEFPSGAVIFAFEKHRFTFVFYSLPRFPEKGALVFIEKLQRLARLNMSMIGIPSGIVIAGTLIIDYSVGVEVVKYLTDQIEPNARLIRDIFIRRLPLFEEYFDYFSSMS